MVFRSQNVIKNIYHLKKVRTRLSLALTCVNRVGGCEELYGAHERARKNQEATGSAPPMHP